MKVTNIKLWTEVYFGTERGGSPEPSLEPSPGPSPEPSAEPSP